MTLKRDLEDQHSPIRRFLKARLPNTPAVRAKWKQLAIGEATIVAPVERVSTPAGGARGYPYDEVGHAASLRLTLLFSPDVPTPARPPVRHPSSGAPWPVAAAVHAELVAMLPNITGFAALAAEIERRLAKLTYVAGLFDQYFRIGPYPGLPLLDVAPDASVDAMLAALVPTACTDDLVSLVTASRPVLARLTEPKGRVVVGPTFAGSGDVGGADADVLVGQTLLEIKTRGRLELQQRHLHQVVGYALLDYEDAYGIEELAWYSARHAALVRMSLDEVLRHLADAPVDRAGLRNELRRHLTGRNDAVKPTSTAPGRL